MKHKNNSPVLQPAELSLEQESIILARVEEQVLQAFREQYGRRRTPVLAEQGSSASRWIWIPRLAWGGSGVLATALLVWVVVWGRGLWEEPVLQGQGVVLSGKHTLSDRVVSLTVASTHPGTLTESKRWNMKITPHSQLTLTKLAHRVRNIQLTRGLITVDVKKGSMREFVVESQKVQVVVTGTLFTVERQASWMRVELWRGEVQIRRSHVAPIIMKPGMGVRIHLPSLVSQEYALPSGLLLPTAVAPVAPQRHRPDRDVAQSQEQSAARRVTWLVEKGRYPELHRYALDLANRRHMTRNERRVLLRQVADLLYRRGYDHRALQTLLAMARLGGEGADTDFAMAINACHKIFRTDTTHCIRLGEEYLQTYRKEGVQSGYYACQLARNMWQRYQKNPKLYAKDKVRVQEIRQQYQCPREK